MQVDAICVVFNSCGNFFELKKNKKLGPKSSKGG